MVEEGTLPEQVDQVIEDFGFALGSFKTNDLSGTVQSIIINEKVKMISTCLMLNESKI